MGAGAGARVEDSKAVETTAPGVPSAETPSPLRGGGARGSSNVHGYTHMAINHPLTARTPRTDFNTVVGFVLTRH